MKKEFLETHESFDGEQSNVVCVYHEQIKKPLNVCNDTELLDIIYRMVLGIVEKGTCSFFTFEPDGILT